MSQFIQCIALVSMVTFAGCKGNDFASQAPQNKKGAPCVETDTQKCDDDGEPKDGDLTTDPNEPKDDFDVNDGGLKILDAKICDSSNIKIISGTGTCDAHSAAYAADDARTATIACCPLPSQNMLKPGTKPGSGGGCQAGDVIVGLSGGAAVCATINTAAFKLGPKQTTCYAGSGASGGKGASSCSAPAGTATAMTATFGSDSCLPTPFGGLITYIGGKNCANISFRSVTKSDGSPVQMYK